MTHPKAARKRCRHPKAARKRCRHPKAARTTVYADGGTIRLFGEAIDWCSACGALERSRKEDSRERWRLPALGKQKQRRSCPRLVRELEQRRNIGARMANVLFNLAQTWPRGQMPSERTLAILDDLRKRWDTIARAKLPELGKRRAGR